MDAPYVVRFFTVQSFSSVMENMRTSPEDGVFRFNGREKQKRRESAVSVLKRTLSLNLCRFLKRIREGTFGKLIQVVFFSILPTSILPLVCLFMLLPAFVPFSFHSWSFLSAPWLEGQGRKIWRTETAKTEK